MSALSPVDDRFDLSKVDPSSTPGVVDRKHAEKQLAKNLDELGSLQEKLFAESRVGGTRSVLLVLQAMDTAGKGGIIRHVVGGVDPQGVHLHAFKAPPTRRRRTTSCGGCARSCRCRESSAYSTARTTRTCSSTGCTASPAPR